MRMSVKENSETLSESDVNNSNTFGLEIEVQGWWLIFAMESD